MTLDSMDRSGNSQLKESAKVIKSRFKFIIIEAVYIFKL